MLRAALRDLQWRRRRFLIAAIGTSLVFAITLILTGLANGFTQESLGTERDLGVDAWVVRDGASGPFMGAVAMLASSADEVARLPGVRSAAPFAFSRKAVGSPPSDVNVLGAPVGGPGVPPPSSGRAPERDGEALASTKLGYDLGDRLALGGRNFVIVGLVDGETALGGVPNVHVTLHDAQELTFSGQPIAMAVATEGVPESAPPGMRVLPRSAALDDLRRPLEQPRTAVTAIALMLWVIAATIVGSVIYLSALERMRDFAVFKAVGVGSSAILAGLALQAVIVSLVAALIGAVIAVLLAPHFPMLVDIPTSALGLLPLIAMAIGVVASLFGLRRVVGVQPALAFGGP